MSLVSQLQNFATRTATESKALRTLINGNATDLSALTTTAKSNLVAALNELDLAIDAIVAGGSATNLDALTDVVITSAAVGHVLRHNGTNWVNVLATTWYEVAGAAASAQAAAIAASQPLDSDLTAIAALTTTTYGRSMLTLANQAALMALLGAATETVAGITTFATTVEAVAGTNTTKAVTSAGVAAALNALVAGAPGLLNTLDEIAAALGDDPNFATTITGLLAGKQPLATVLTNTTAAFTTAYETKLAGIAAAATANQTDAYLLSRANHTGTESVDNHVDGTTNKVYTAAEKTKLGGIAAGATANSSDATLLNRANHTGSQLAATISDFAAAADARVAAGITGKQPLDTDLTAIAALVSAANVFPYATGAGTWALATVTAQARLLLDDTTALEMRTTIDVYSKAEVGDPATDFVATFNAGLV